MTWPSTFSAGDELTAAEMNAILVAGNAWTSYTPTLTNVTKGNGTLVGRYNQVGKTVDFIVQLTLGSTSSVTAGISLSLPVTASMSGWVPIGSAFDTSATNTYPIAGVTSTTVIAVRVWNSSAGGFLQGTGTNTPFTWTTGDILTISGRYEAA